MKVVIGEWWKDKNATIRLILHFIFNVTWYITEANMIIVVGQAMEAGDLVGGLLYVLGICAVWAIAECSEIWFSKTASFRCYRSMCNRFSDKILDADYDLFTHFSVAKVMTISEFMGHVTAIAKTMVRLLMNISQLIIIFVSMYVIAGNMVFPVVSVYLVYAFASRFLYSIYNKKDHKINKVRKQRNQMLENMINGFQEVRSFSMVEYERNMMYNTNTKLHDMYINREKIDMIICVIIEIVDTIGIMMVVGWCLYQINAGLLAPAVGMSMVMFVLKAINPILSISDFVGTLSDELKQSADYKELIEWVNRTKRGTLELDQFERQIELRDVSFAYENSSTVLDGVNMMIPKGHHIGICGKTGDGKSTLLKLLNKFYCVDTGHIFIDGVDIDCITAASFRKHVGSVHQESFIFPGTILQNVKYGSPEATEYQIIEACKKARLYDFIVSLKDGFNTDVGPKGLKLSGGQKQRIALARLFLQDPEIIILDEATSALDNETELFIQDAINALQGKTIVTVAHRLTTIQHCDKIYVLDGGKVAESGTHDELMTIRGIYHHMYTAKS